MVYVSDLSPYGEEGSQMDLNEAVSVACSASTSRAAYAITSNARVGMDKKMNISYLANSTHRTHKMRTSNPQGSELL